MPHHLNVTSEIGQLETVVVHRPGPEIDNLTPDSMTALLFDDIPYLPTMQQEHDRFVEILRERGVDVLYVRDLLAQALAEESVRLRFLDAFLAESGARETRVFPLLQRHLSSLAPLDLVDTLIAGVARRDLPAERPEHLSDLVTEPSPFFLDPMPNLYFTRDPAAVIGGGVAVSRMRWPARQRESLFMHYIAHHHPLMQGAPVWYERPHAASIEGGDELVLSPEVLCVGISERTSAEAVELLARRLLGGSSGFRSILAVEIPKLRSCMHLDTVFTQVDVDKFTLHPTILGGARQMHAFVLDLDSHGDLRITPRDGLEAVLRSSLGLTEVDLIPCGGGDLVAASREQWNDASNTFAVSPGVVLTYDRNRVSNAVLRQHGVEVIEVPSSELSRGRGGPRCMSMPLRRRPLFA